MGAGAYHFVPWVRTGIGALLGGAPRPVGIALGDAGTVTLTLGGHTPDDVIGLDPRAIIRMVPPPGACDHEPNIFASVELEHPALPWLVSPTGAGDHVVPWIVLVVVRDQPGVELQALGAVRVLAITSPARAAAELPDLAQASAWAHAQATGPALDPAALARSVGESRARLLAPRALAPRTSYVACIVPAFAGGVAAMLGETAADPMAPAWSGAETALRLPVLHAWRFTTGDGGDFASLARAIQPMKLSAAVGGRTIDIAEPGWGAPAAPGARLEVGGALRSLEWVAPPPPAPALVLGASIVAALDAPPVAGGAPTFPPPAYGSAAARVERVATAPPWLRDLNRDVGQRIAAGLGAAVVRAHQDAFVEAAWREVGDAEAANALIRRCELAAELTRGLARRHVVPLTSDGEVLSIARPLLARMRVPGTAPGRPTVAAAIRASALPSAALAPALRRAPRVAVPGVVLERIDAGVLVAAPPPHLARGAAAFDHVETTPDRPRLALLTPAAVDTAAAHWRARVPRPVPAPTRPLHPALARERARERPEIPDGEVPHRPPPLDEDTVLDPIVVDEFRLAARRHQAYVLEKLTPPAGGRPRFGTGATRPFGVIRAAIEAQFAPEAGVLPLLAARLEGAGVSAGFQPIRITPVLERPILPLLHQLSPEHVMPCITDLLRDRAAVAISGPDFVRAVLVGANEELGRELLWRGFPAALGHTWLRTFWGRSVVGPDGARVAVPDIPPIDAWPAAGPPTRPAELVLIIRAELFARYPNAVVYANPARWVGAQRNLADVAPTFPVISARLGGDLVLFGFDLSADVVRGGVAPPADPGWYFVIAEHPSEPRFGLAARSFGPPARWRDLAWSDLAPDDLRGSYLRTDGPLAQRALAGPPAATWGHDAASLAALTLRVPTRVAFHATTLVP